VDRTGQDRGALTETGSSGPLQQREQISLPLLVSAEPAYNLHVARVGCRAVDGFSTEQTPTGREREGERKGESDDAV
jgi:hypothetical protein